MLDIQKEIKCNEGRIVVHFPMKWKVSTTKIMEKESKIKMSINGKLSITFLLALLIPSLLISTTSFFVSKQEIEDQILFSGNQSVESVNEFINRHVEPIVNDVTYFASTISPTQLEKENWEMLLKELEQYYETSEGIVSSFIGTADGDMIQFPDLGLMNNPDFDPRTRAWYQNAMENPGQVIIANPHQAASTGEWVVNISKKIENADAVFSVNLSMTHLNDLVNSVTIGNEGYAFLMTESKTIIVHPTLEAGTDVSEEDWANKMFETDLFEYSFEGNAKQMIVHTNDLTGWKIGGTFFVDEINDSVQPILLSTLFVVIGSLIILGIYIIVILRSIAKPLRMMTTVAVELSEGNLNTKINIDKKDEIGILGKSLQKMSYMLSSIIRQIHEKSTVISSSAEELSATIIENNKSIENIANSMTSVKQGLEDQTNKINQSFQALTTVSNEIHEISNYTYEVTKKAEEAEKTVDIGQEIVISTQQQMRTIENTINQLSNDIETLNNYAREIDEIVNVITSISEQTNLLALNAAIEAARAGEHGKGFAVVADEVRKLAEQTNHSSIQVKEIISALQVESANSVQSMNNGVEEVAKGLEMFAQTETNFMEMKQFIEQITDQLQIVLERAKTISQNSEKVVSDMTIVSEISNQSKEEINRITMATEEQLCSIEEISTTVESLEQIVEDLLKEVETFKLSEEQ